MPNTGRAGFTNAAVQLTYGGSYSGDGLNGWVGGTTVTFNVRMRKPKLVRPRHDTTDSGYVDGVGGPVGLRFEMDGYFKTGTIPPSQIMQEYIKIQVTCGFTYTAVILVEEFEDEGVVDGALKYRLSGTSVGTFTQT